MGLKELIWSQKYRPRTVSDCILPSGIKNLLLGFVEAKQIPNITFSGPAGVGKTSAALALVQDLGAEWIFIDCPLEGNIDTLRTKIKDFATTVSFGPTDVKKYVVLDEADRLTALTQDALKTFIEAYSVNCGFILTTNHANKLIEPLLSRAGPVSFVIPEAEYEPLIKEQFKMCMSILEKEGVTTIDKTFVGKTVMESYPDLRKAINSLQLVATSLNGTPVQNSLDVTAVIPFIKSRSYDKIRTWVAKTDADPQTLFSEFYSKAETLVKKESVPTLVVLLAEYQYKARFVADQQINLAAFFAQVMMECEWQ